MKGKRVFIRVDFNVPLKRDGENTVVADDIRIRAALPTLRWVMDREGLCIVATHLGRPDGNRVDKYSAEPIADRLSELLQMEVIFSHDTVGDGPKSLSHQLRPNQVLMLENLRFLPGEEANSVDFSNRLLDLCDVYVSDAFGTLHRAHASTFGLPKLVRDKAVGFLVQKELQHLVPLRDSPKRPFILIMGGAKVSDKIGILEHFMPLVDKILIGGAMAYSFLKAQGHEVGKSLCDDKQVALASRIIEKASTRGVSLLLPVDHRVVPRLENPEDILNTSNADIPSDWMGVDIGAKTLAVYKQALRGAETIFWNGPMGVFETPAFAQGTFELAKAIGNTNAQKIAGGGDVAAAIHQSGSESRFDFISTGGGATLEFLEGKDLPGLKALEVS